MLSFMAKKFAKFDLRVTVWETPILRTIVVCEHLSTRWEDMIRNSGSFVDCTTAKCEKEWSISNSHIPIFRKSRSPGPIRFRGQRTTSE
jgi:hypothetical protein